ncbi:MAG: Mur ligase domain-containing protein [Candidatus Krumholzibacteriia bacterium]
MSSSETVVVGPGSWLHFVGAGGSGMSALALLHAGGSRAAGGRATGSDRAFDHGEREAIRQALAAAGVEIRPQDGSGLVEPSGRRCDAVIASTAVEDAVPDLTAARKLGIPILHRSELLARHVESHRTVAVTGTSGKSTVTAMVFAILQDAGWGPGLLTGGALAELTARGHLGNAWAPTPPADPAAAADPGPPWLVIEADESDGSLVRYRPHVGLVLNLGLDHKPPAEVLGMFATFKARTRGVFVMPADENLASLREGAAFFGLRDQRPAGLAGTWAEGVDLRPRESRFIIDGVPFRLPQPGIHNVLNAAAAVAACRACGLTVEQTAGPLARFQGVARRFQPVGTARDVEVIDDFAHNPDKIAAALATARRRLRDAGRGRVLAVFQPHGFGPTRFLRDALVDTFASCLRPRDVLWLPEIFFAGGTVTRDISSADLAGAVSGRGRDARFIPDRAGLPSAIAEEAGPGDLVLVMGARDPSLTDLCRDILTALG